MAELTDRKKAEEIEKYLKVLQQIRLPWEDTVDDLLRFVNHSRRLIADNWSNMPNQYYTKGRKTGTEVFSDAAILARNILVDGMAGSYCPRNTPWYKYALPGRLNFPRVSVMRQWTGKRMDEYPAVKKWLQDASEATLAAYNFSNFYDVITEFVSDAAVPGTANIFAEEEIGKGRIVFTVPHFRECYIAENQYGRVDTIYRLYNLTLRQLADKFGMDIMNAADKGFKKAYEENFHFERQIIHAVFPRSDYDGSRIDAKGKPIASLWVYRSGGQGVASSLLDESGYDWLPFSTWRWRKNSDEWYGRSPAWDAWTSIARSNQEAKSNMMAAQKMVEPPLVIPADLRGAVQTGPNGKTYIDNYGGDIRTRAPMPLNQNIQLPFSVDAENKTRQIIDEHFHTPFFQMLLQMTMNKVTASPTQVIEMMGEQAAVLGTRMGNFEGEGLNPIHDRVFEIEARAGRMPPPPQILLDSGGRKIPQIMYQNALSQAQVRLSKVRTIQSGVQMAGQIAQIVGPVAIDKIDVDEVMDEIFDAAGFPESCIRDEKQVQQIREIRNKKQEQMEKLEAMKVVPKAAAAMSKTAQEGSPMKALMGDQEGEAANG
jgi:hypothetical protein